MADIITTIIKDESLSANVGNVVKIVEKDYNNINNKPQINGVTLQGDKSALELGLVPTDLSELEAVEQPIKSVRQTADMFVDNGGKPSKIALQQVKDMATKVVYADELGNVDFEKLDIDDYVILGDKIYRVVDAENNIKQLLPETSAEHVTFADKKGEYDSTNVEDALAEVMDIAKTGGVTGVKGDAETEYRKGNVNITKENIGLGNVDNTADKDKPISNAQKTVNTGFEHNFEQLNSNIDTLGKGLNERIDATNSNLAALRESTESALSNQQESINDIDSTLNSHIANQSNPHNVTKAQVGLDKVDNTADVDKSVKEAKKATNDGAGNNIVDTYASKQYVQEGLAGKSRSISFADYQAFVTAVNGYGNTTLKVSDNVFVKTLGVPDMWVTAVNSEKAAYTYTNDQAIVNALNTTNGLTVGYYTFSLLETEKIDLTSYQTKTDDGLNTTNKTVVGAINEVKGTADNALSKANTNATEISQIKDGTTKVKKAEHADTTDNATNVTTNINGKAISSIFETNGTTAKEATHAGKATSADKATQADSASKVANNLTFSGQNAQGTESIIGFNGSQAREVAFNGDDFLVTNGNAFEVSIVPSGATAGTYNNVTVDEKGRVTGGENKDYATTEQVNAKYTKPESGIPKSDLAEDVKTSLGKADTAVQSDDLSVYAKKAELATVATSGSYNDLSNKPTNYVTTDTEQSISAIKTFTVNQKFFKSDMDISKASSTNKYSYIAFDDSHNLRAGVLGGMQTTDNYCGTYLQARNGQQIRILSNADGSITKTSTPTPPDADDSTQIANTKWVLRNYNAADICYRGVDTNTKYAGYYKVAEATLPDWYRVSSARVFVQDFDSADNGVLNVNVYAGSTTVDGVATASTTAQVGFLEGTNINGIKGRFFLVVRKQSSTERQPIKVELWYRQTSSKQRISATFLNDIGDSRGGLTASNKWVKFTRTDAQEQNYFDKGVVDLTNGFVPNGKFTTTDIALDGYPVTEIYDDSTNNAQFVAGHLRIANNQVARSDTPATTSSREILFTDKNNEQFAKVQASIGNRFNGINLILINKAAVVAGVQLVYDSNGDVWRFNPINTTSINLGENSSSRRFGNAYVKNIFADNIPLIPFYSDNLSTGTYRSTNLPSGCSLVYIEDRQGGLSGYLYKNSGAMEFNELYFVTNFYTALTDAQTNLTIYKLKINGTQVEKTYKNLFVSSNGSVEVGEEYAENGTFYYKVLK